ncbi:NUDIX domain-containing protein [Candidatus Falkowbacteria bacterium]|jgi:8-oxo-dGTP diphosphatase|nr:NUDIX domain-containing protein [Candidatus Falkowbacteria bacterium]MBT7007282.1 NUDIX domain-containing protein [Candidatus Falkowbacteria bacterium]
MKDRFRLVCASYLIIRKENKMLLHLRQNSGFMDGYYGFVSGHLDGNESFTQCMIREAKEEAGIDIQAADLNVIHVANRSENLNPVPLKERVDVFFEASKWQGEIKNMEPEKCAGLEWFDVDKLPDNIIPYNKKVLEQIDNKKNYSEIGY